MRAKLQNDAVVALKSGENKKSQALRYLVSILDKEAMRKNVDTLTEEESVRVLQKELKNKQESLESFKKANRSDLCDEVCEEVKWLEEYLPKQLTDLELEKIINSVVATQTNFGQIMKEVNILVAGRADGARVVAMVKCKI